MKKTYIYVADPPSLGRADRQILAQHACPWGDIDEGEEDDFRYFYLHDRLGSVRLVIDYDGEVVKHYTYEPFGELIDSDVAPGTQLDNPFMFTGQYFDAEIEEYYRRARQYNPGIARFTSRDPIKGTFLEPMTVHQYLYCLNDPINRTDLSGEKSLSELMTSMSVAAGSAASTGSAFAGQVWRMAQNVYTAAYVRAMEIGWMVQGVSLNFNRYSDLPNRLNHIFARGGLNAELAKQYGSRAAAFWAVQGAISSAMAGTNEVFNRVVVEVGGYAVSVNGNVIDGVVMIGTFVVTGKPGG